MRYALLFACAIGWHAQAADRVTGTATYPQSIPLPPGAVFEATLEDVSKAGARAEALGTARVERPGNPPIAFEIPYDRSRIDPRRRYSVRARIVLDGRLLYTTDTHVPILTEGSGNEVALTLRPPGGPVSVENTYWKLTRLGGQRLTLARWPEEPHLILHPDSRRVSASGGCNRFTGPYKLEGEELRFGRIAGTLKACKDSTGTEKDFLAVLGQVRKARVSRQQLQLLDAEGKPLARFEAVYLR
jgi:putative lipoprotein